MKQEQKQVIFLCGPINCPSPENFREFGLVQEQVESLGHIVLNPHEFFEGVDTTNWLPNDFMKVVVARMMQADLALTLPKWEDSKEATNLVDILRIAETKIEHSIIFLKRQGITLTSKN